jgi:hypothetical protein
VADAVEPRVEFTNPAAVSLSSLNETDNRVAESDVFS